eukprot:TRINITY_DN6674_c0_g5_i4.p1 TRINITY_DN6674_c0_g5~~TRINITY_DN6674_c0_g5_i4.p1  ORF type:complete len:250 (+),score=10.86 TRINITY_DN6674_c0_g5_i4:30-752(+)
MCIRDSINAEYMGSQLIDSTMDTGDQHLIPQVRDAPITTTQDLGNADIFVNSLHPASIRVGGEVIAPPHHVESPQIHELEVNLTSFIDEKIPEDKLPVKNWGRLALFLISINGLLGLINLISGLPDYPQLVACLVFFSLLYTWQALIAHLRDIFFLNVAAFLMDLFYLVHTNTNRRAEVDATGSYVYYFFLVKCLQVIIELANCVTFFRAYMKIQALQDEFHLTVNQMDGLMNRFNNALM